MGKISFAYLVSPSKTSLSSVPTIIPMALGYRHHGIFSQFCYPFRFDGAGKASSTGNTLTQNLKKRCVLVRLMVKTQHVLPVSQVKGLTQRTGRSVI